MPSHSRSRRPAVVLLAVMLAAGVAASVGAWTLRNRAGGEEPAAVADAAFGAAPGLAAAAHTCAGRPVSAPRQLRGVWITTVNNIDWPSRPGLPEERVKAEYRGWLDLAVKRNLNAVFVHVRPSGDALWPSERAPWSEWLTGRRDGRDPGWDPMAWMVAETHARNLEFHAWFNPYRGGQPGPKGPGGDVNALAPNHPLRAHPDWVVTYPKAGTAGSRLYFNPGVPAARRFVEDAMLEAVERYDVDGVHFDDFFYPYPVSGRDFPDSAAFARYGKGFASRADWRRDNVNTLVREMSERIKAVKPWVKFGISPFGIWRNRATDPAGSASSGLESYDAIYADTRLWVRKQWLDYIVPQLYWHIGFARADYAKLLPWWAAQVKGTRVQLYIGQADYRVGERGAWRDPAQLDRQLALNGRYGVAGSVHFSAKQMRADRLGAVSRYAAAHYATPALPPVMSHLPRAVPAPPAAAPGGGGATLSWRPSGATAYAVYRVDGAAARLVGTTRGSSWTDPATAGPATYCVSGLDRSGNEGEMSAPVSVSPAGRPHLLVDAGHERCEGCGMGVHDRLINGLGVQYLPSPTGQGALRLPAAGKSFASGGPAPRVPAPPEPMARRAGGGTTGQGRHRAEPDADAVPLMEFALKLTGGDRERSELIVAETLAYAVDQAPPPGPRRRPWLIAIVRRFATDISWPERETVDRVLARMGVAGALEILSRPHREILVETYFRGRSIAEAAEILDLPVVTAQTRLAYALRALRNASTG